MLVCTLRNSVAFFFLFFTLDMAFLMLAIGEYTETAACLKAGGYFGLFAAFAAWYCALAQMLNRDNSYFTLPVSDNS
jgi:succinate-acetate transporter protein